MTPPTLPDNETAGDESAPALRRVVRCTYCRKWKDLDEYTRLGDHVIPASLGGRWVDPRVCGSCNTQANRVGDELIAHDFLIRLLRSRYEVKDRNGKIPNPPVIPIKIRAGGVVKVTLGATGPVFQAGLPPTVSERLGLEDPNDQAQLQAIVDESLAPLDHPDADQTRELARRGQPLQTAPDTWSRFMAKLGLACGRDAFGDDWLDMHQAVILSEDLLRGHPPRFGQRWFYPPVEPAWPFEPPKHRLWIQPSDGVAVLWIALFGEVLGAVPINDLSAEPRYSAWSLDPVGSTGEARVRRGNYETLYGASVAARATKLGANVVSIPHLGVTYVLDGPDGPIDLGIELPHVDSIEEAIDYVKRNKPGT
jgi:hypothetical protein